MPSILNYLPAYTNPCWFEKKIDGRALSINVINKYVSSLRRTIHFIFLCILCCLKFLKKALRGLKFLTRTRPAAIVVDLHPVRVTRPTARTRYCQQTPAPPRMVPARTCPAPHETRTEPAHETKLEP